MPDIFDAVAETPASVRSTTQEQPGAGLDIFDLVADDTAGRAYRLLNDPDSRLVELALSMGAQLAARKPPTPAPFKPKVADPDLPAQYIGPERQPEPQRGPAPGQGRPADFDQEADPTGMADFIPPAGPVDRAIAHGLQSSALGLAARRKLPDAMTQGEQAGMGTGQRLAMQAGQLAGDFPLMVFGGLLGLEGGPAGVAYGSFALPAGIRQIYLDQITKGEVENFGQFAFRLAVAVDHANKEGFVGMATAGAGGAVAEAAGKAVEKGLVSPGLARLAEPVARVSAEVSAMTAVGAGMQGHVPDAQEFLDAALMVGGLHAAGAVARGDAARAVGDARAAWGLAGKLQDIYGRTGKRPAEVALEAEVDPSLKEHLLSEAQDLPPEYEKIAREQENLARGYDRVKSDPLGGPAGEVLATIEPADIERLIMKRGPAIERDGEIVVSGRTLERETGSKSGYGMVKIIWKHGEMSNESPELQVRKDDVVNIPQQVRDYAPIVSDQERMTWRVPRDDGRTITVSAKRGAEEGSLIVTMHVDRESGLAVSSKREGLESPEARMTRPEDTGQGITAFTPGGPDPVPTSGKNDITTPGAEIKPTSGEGGRAAPQPWEMTRGEFEASGQVGVFPYETIVRRASGRGEPVPARVLEQFRGQEWADGALAGHGESASGARAPLAALPDAADRAGGEAQGRGGQSESTADSHAFFNTGRAATDVPYPANKPVMPAGEVRSEDAVRISDVVHLLEDKLGAPIRTGKLNGQGLSRDVLGLYKTKPEVIRSRIANNISVIAHEVGHHLQKVVFGGIKEAPLEPWRAELSPMATVTKEGKPGTLTEGFAEFVAKYVANPEQAKALAPKFLVHFEAELAQKAPEIKAVLLDAREMVRKWAEQPAVMEVLSHIDKGGSRAGAAWKLLFRPETWHDLYTVAVDDLHNFARIVMDMAEGKDLAASQNPEALARLFRGWTGKAGHFLEHGTLDFKTLDKAGAPLKDILNRVENWDELRSYLAALRSLELETRGIESGIRAEAAKASVQELAPKYKDVARAIYDYQDQVLKYLADSGVLTQDAIRVMREANKYYVPFFRVMDTEPGAGGAGGKAMSSRNPVKQIKGSGRDIIDPLESILKNTYVMVNLAERNRIGLALVDLAAKTEGMGKYVERIPTPMTPTSVHGEEVLRAIREVDPEAAKLLGDAYEKGEFDTTIFRPSQRLDRNTEIAVFRDGKREVYQVHPDLAQAVNGLGAEQMPIFVKLLAYPARALRAGATLTPDFILRNSIRDPISAAVFSKWGFVPGVDTVRGLFSLFKADELYQEWVKSGAGHSMWVSLDRQYLQRGLEDLRESGVLDRVRNVVRHPLEMLRIASENAEAATRLGEFGKAMKKAQGEQVDRLMQAGLAAREVTLDFARIGSGMRWFNATIPFTNARVQGLDKLVRTFMENPLGATAKAAAWITLPSVLLTLANYQFASEEEVQRVMAKKTQGLALDPLEQDIFMREGVKNLPRWQRDLFWIVPAGGALWRIPKPFELGVIFGTIPERITEWILDRGRGDAESKPFAQLGTTILEGVKPAMVPTAAVPFLENWGNRSFLTGNRIVPADREGMLPEYQYTPSTTELVKGMSRALGHLPYGNITGLDSPAQVENIIRGWTGGLGMYLVQSADFGLRHAGLIPDPVKPAATLADLPVIRAFVARHPSANTQPIIDFYEHWDQAQKVAKSIAGMRKEMNFDAMQALMGRDYSGALQGIHEAMSNMNAFIRMVAANPEMTPDKKRELMDTTYLQLNAMAKEGNRIWDRVQEERGKVQ